MPALRLSALIFAALLLATLGCNLQRSVLNAFPQQEAAATQTVALLLAGDITSLKERMDLALKGPDIDKRLAKMEALFPEGDPLSIKVIGIQSLRTSSSLQTDVVLEYEFATGWMLAQVGLNQTDSTILISAFNVEAESDSVEHVNEFTLHNRSVGQFIFLAAAVADLAFVLYVFVRCARTRMRRKWIWLCASAVGLGAMSLNWSTAGIAWRIFWIQIPPTSAAHDLYNPWVFGISFPLGAMACFAHLRGLAQNTSESQPGAASDSTQGPGTQTSDAS